MMANNMQLHKTVVQCRKKTCLGIVFPYSSLFQISVLVHCECNTKYFSYFQEKKGAAPMDPAQREQFEIAKLEKLIAMVREPTESAQTS